MKRIIFFILIMVTMLSCTPNEQKRDVTRNIVTPNGREAPRHTESSSTKEYNTFIVHTSSDMVYSIPATDVVIGDYFVRYKIGENDNFPTRISTNTFIYHIVENYDKSDYNVQHRYHTLEFVLSNGKKLSVEATHYIILGGRIEVRDKNITTNNKTFMMLNVDFIDYFKMID